MIGAAPPVDRRAHRGGGPAGGGTCLPEGMAAVRKMRPPQDDRRRMPFARKRELPTDVLVLAPLQRRVGARRDAGTQGPAPLRPVVIGVGTALTGCGPFLLGYFLRALRPLSRTEDARDAHRRKRPAHGQEKPSHCTPRNRAGLVLLMRSISSSVKPCSRSIRIKEIMPSV